MQYYIATYNNTAHQTQTETKSYTVHRHCVSLCIVSTGSIAIIHFFCFKFFEVVGIVIALMTLVEVVLR